MSREITAAGRTGVGYSTTSGKNRSGVMMMMSVFLMASNCRYHGTSVTAGAAVSADADPVVFCRSVDAITSLKHFARPDLARSVSTTL